MIPLMIFYCLVLTVDENLSSPKFCTVMTQCAHWPSLILNTGKEGVTRWGETGLKHTAADAEKTQEWYFCCRPLLHPGERWHEDMKTHTKAGNFSILYHVYDTHRQSSHVLTVHTNAENTQKVMYTHSVVTHTCTRHKCIREVLWEVIFLWGLLLIHSPLCEWEC